MDYIKYLSDINSNFCDSSGIRTKNITNLKRIEAAYYDAIESEDYNTLINKTIYTDISYKQFLEDINAFRYTPIGRLDGFIYVNPDLWDVYRTDETWKYFYSIIKPYNVEEITTTINFVVNELPTEDDYQFI